MARNVLVLLITSFMLLSACSPSVQLYTDIDETAKFDNFTSYNFLAFSEGNKTTITGMELERIKVAFAREFESRGLVFSEENSDVSVKITIYHRQATSSYGYSGLYNYLERALAVDMYDNQNRNHIWHCAAVGEIEYDPEKRAAGLSEVLAKIFENYPVQPTHK